MPPGAFASFPIQILVSLFATAASTSGQPAQRSAYQVTTISAPDTYAYDVDLVPIESGFLAMWVEKRTAGNGQVREMRYQRLDKLGHTTGTSVPIEPCPPGSADGESDIEFTQLSLTSDGVQAVYALWEQVSQGPAGELHRQVAFMASRNGGSSFSACRNLSESLAPSQPRIAAGSRGEVVVAFTNLDEQTLPLLYEVSSDYGQTFSNTAQTPISTEMNSSPMHSDFALNSDGVLCATWDAGHVGDATYDIFLACSRDLGDTWSTPINVSRTSQYSQSPSLVALGDGRMVVVWQDARSGVFAIYSRVFDLGSDRVSKEFRLNPRDASRPAAMDAAVGVLGRTLWTTWFDGLAPRYSVGVLRRRGLGLVKIRFETIVAGWGGAGQPKIAVTRDGAVGMAWVGCERAVCAPEPIKVFFTVLKNQTDK